MKPTIAWKSPALLPENPDAPKAQLNSMEISAQNERMKTTVAAQYFSDNSVPSSPAPLSQIEQALDMTAQSSANIAKIPFFAAQATEAPAPAAASIPAQQALPEFAAPPPEAPASFGATPEFVQALGLPLFLVGQSTQALQTLAASPGLLNSLVDSSGTYDQARLLSLVQTLSGAPAPAVPPAAPPAPYVPQAPPPVVNSYGTSGGYSTYGASNSFGAPPPKVNMRTSDEGNLHVSGYGYVLCFDVTQQMVLTFVAIGLLTIFASLLTIHRPMTTQADIIALFSQYVVVDEVVMKGSFCFVNTRGLFFLTLILSARILYECLTFWP